MGDTYIKMDWMDALMNSKMDYENRSFVVVGEQAV